MVGGTHLHAHVLQLVVVLGEHVEVFHLKGHVVQPQRAFLDRLGVGRSLEQGQVVVDLAAGEEGAEPGAVYGNFKPQDFGVELRRGFLVAHVDYQMPHSLGLDHDCNLL